MSSFEDNEFYWHEKTPRNQVLIRAIGKQLNAQRQKAKQVSRPLWLIPGSGVDVGMF